MTPNASEHATLRSRRRFDRDVLVATLAPLLYGLSDFRGLAGLLLVGYRRFMKCDSITF